MAKFISIPVGNDFFWINPDMIESFHREPKGVNLTMATGQKYLIGNTLEDVIRYLQNPPSDRSFVVPS